MQVRQSVQGGLLLHIHALPMEGTRSTSGNAVAMGSVSCACIARKQVERKRPWARRVDPETTVD
jgi:hypothetical protein